MGGVSSVSQFNPDTMAFPLLLTYQLVAQTITSSLTEDYNLELQYRKPFLDVWREEKNDPEFGPLSERMRVRDVETGKILISDEEVEAACK